MRGVTGAGQRLILGLTLAALCTIGVVFGRETGYDAGYQAGYQANRADERSDMLRLVCTLPGQVPNTCSDLGLPECTYEDGTPEGCLSFYDPRQLWWVVNLPHDPL